MKQANFLVRVMLGMVAVGLFTGANLQAKSGEGEYSETLLVSERIANIPYGLSGISYTFTKGPVLQKFLRVEFGGPSCLDTQLYRLDYANSDAVFRKASYRENGTFETNGFPVRKLMFNFSRTQGGHALCEIRVYGVTHEVVTPGPIPPGPGPIPPTKPEPKPLETFAGLIRYNGGFLQNEIVPLASPANVKGFRILVPKYCSQAEIIEAGTLTEGIYQKAEATEASDREFIVKEGHGTIAGSLSITINGPVDLKCTIPVYYR